MVSTFGEVHAVDLYTSGPSSIAVSDAQHLHRLEQVAQWSDRHGCRGMLIYTDNKSVDPWVLAQHVIQHTTMLSPLIAVQPVYMHPYAVAQKISALARLYGRAVDLNLVAGGFQFDLAALGDRLPHDRRYARLAEYGALVTRLLGSDPVTFKGTYYSVFGLQLGPGISKDLMPRLTVSGSSPGGLKCAESLGATAITYPEPPSSDFTGRSDAIDPVPGSVDGTGIRIGILARESADDAWAEAVRRFPPDADRQARQEAVAKTSDSLWFQRLSALAQDHSAPKENVYWLGPFRNLQSFCPYLVGSYDSVAAQLSAYLRDGVRVIILDCPHDEADLVLAATALRLARRPEVARSTTARRD